MAPHVTVLTGAPSDEWVRTRFRPEAWTGTEVEIIPSGAFSRETAADVLVVGPSVAEPLAAARAFRRSHPSGQVLFVRPAERVEQFRNVLPFAPEVAEASVVAADISPSEFKHRVDEAVAAIGRRRAIRGLYNRINAQIGAVPVPGDAAGQSRHQALAERYLAAILTHAPDAFLAVAPDGTVASWNDAAAHLFGRSWDEVAGQPFADLVIGEDQPQAAAILDRAALGESLRGQELRIECADGALLTLEVSAGPVLGGSGAIEGISLTARDITERRQAEEALRLRGEEFSALADNIPLLCWMADPDGDIFWYNRRWYEYTGTTPETQQGWGWESVHDPALLPGIAAEWRRSLATGLPFETVFPLRGADGSYRTFLTRAIPIRDEDGRIVRWFGSNVDITDQIRAEEALRELNETLERRVEEEVAERAKAEEALRQAQKMEAVGQLTGGIAHDFNNLLTGIVGALDLLQRRVAEGRLDGLQRYTTVAITSAQRAAALTQRLLAFSRRQPLDPKAIDANKLVASMEDLLRRSLGPAIDLELVLAGGLWPTLCDPNQLESAVLNLAINARDAMPEGGRLTIETANTHLDEAYAAANAGEVKPGQYVCICVTDTGTGIPPDIVSRIFEPFFTTKPLGQGTGLGLSQLYGFVKQSGGHVKVYSEEGQGTTFRLYLPRHRGKAQTEGAAERSEEVQRAEAGETVLVVEDEAAVRMLVSETLEELGYVAIEAVDGPSGLRVLQSDHRVDLLITDVGLPGLNGRQLADAARQSRPGLKVLFVTGFAGNAVIGNGVLEPGMEMLTKPFAMDQLAAKIRAMMQGG